VRLCTQDKKSLLPQVSSGGTTASIIDPQLKWYVQPEELAAPAGSYSGKIMKAVSGFEYECENLIDSLFP